MRPAKLRHATYRSILQPLRPTARAPRALLLAEFLGEAAEVITHADSRVWRTFVPLLFRPGFLTEQIWPAGAPATCRPSGSTLSAASLLLLIGPSFATHSTRMTVADPAKAAAGRNNGDRPSCKRRSMPPPIRRNGNPRKQLEAFRRRTRGFPLFTNGGDLLDEMVIPIDAGVAARPHDQGLSENRRG